jgi:hypothetical protein
MLTHISSDSLKFLTALTEAIPMRSQPEQRQKVLLFIHGVRNDDRDANWRQALDDALLREGTESLEARGYHVIAPTYLAELEAERVPEVDEPAMTYRKSSDEEYARAAGRYWAALADLERTRIRGRVQPKLGAGLPANGMAEKLMPTLFADAVRYRADADRRHAIFARILAEIPPNADLVIVAHSLGSVVAADLLYRLPEHTDVRMLITLGSPLALEPLRKHLTRRRQRFPYEMVGPWINLCGTRDLVTGFRGLSPVFAEALDVFVDTGLVHDAKTAHAATTYLDRPAAARAIEWVDRQHEARDGGHGEENPDLPDIFLDQGLVSVVAGAQYALWLGQEMPPGDQRTRFGQARAFVMGELAATLADAGHTHPILARLAYNNAAYLKNSLSPALAVNTLLTAWAMNVVAPFEIRIDEDVRVKALTRLAADLGFPKVWVETISECAAEARSAHREGLTWQRAALAAAGVAALVAAPALVLVAAPAGLAGGAAIVAGLAALGPGGMLGGVAIVGLVGGAGGAAAATALTAGSAAQVERNVIHLQTLAKASRQLGHAAEGHPEWSALVTMEDALTDELARLRLFSDDGARSVKELEKKLASVHRALSWLEAEDLDPARLSVMATA